MNILVLGATCAARERALAGEGAIAAPTASTVAIESAALPFTRPSRTILRATPPRVIQIREIHEAFPNFQSSGTRLVLTQSTYLLQKWLDTIDQADRIVATADRAMLQRGAPEAFERRGPWRSFTIVDLDDVAGIRLQPDSSPAVPLQPDSPVPERLLRAYQSTSAEERVALCRDAAAASPDSEIAHLALASACRERQDLASARSALDAAIRLAPDWEAAHYENGKFWLACENLIEARDAFDRASALMPTFSAALGNLGATLGELGEPQEALSAFERALAVDPDNFTIVNNIGVVTRELGRLAESEAACRRVIALAPHFVFGHYNLGHTLFLGGRFADALAAYEQGQRRDPEKNRRQACRLAMARFANGDVAGAEHDLWQYANLAPPDEREELFLEAREIAEAVMRARPELAVHQAFVARIASEVRGS